jgi:hypothetical protein
MKKATLYAAICGTLAALLLLCFANQIGTLWLRDTRTVPSLRLFASDTHTEQLRINSITVRDTDGSTLAVIPEDDFLATVSITNLTAESDLLILLAAYTEEGQYQGMMWVSVEDLTPGATIKVTVPMDNPNGSITNLKAFVVNSFADPTPMGTVISFLP